MRIVFCKDVTRSQVKLYIYNVKENNHKVST